MEKLNVVIVPCEQCPPGKKCRAKTAARKLGEMDSTPNLIEIDEAVHSHTAHEGLMGTTETQGHEVIFQATGDCTAKITVTP